MSDNRRDLRTALFWSLVVPLAVGLLLLLISLLITSTLLPQAIRK